MCIKIVNTENMSEVDLFKFYVAFHIPKFRKKWEMMTYIWSSSSLPGDRLEALIIWFLHKSTNVNVNILKDFLKKTVYSEQKLHNVFKTISLLYDVL